MYILLFIQTLFHEGVNEIDLHCQASLGGLALPGPELRAWMRWATQGDCREGAGQGTVLWGSQTSLLIRMQCSFYLRSPDHYLGLFNLNQAEKATAPKAGHGETGTRVAAGGQSQYRHGGLPRPLAVSLETRGFSRYSITHPTGILPGYRPLCVASPWLL